LTLPPQARLPRARPTSLPVRHAPRSRAVRRSTLLWVRLPPIDFCSISILDAWAHPRAPDFRVSQGSRRMGAIPRRLALASRRIDRLPSPCEEERREHANRDSPSDDVRTMLQGTARWYLRKPPPSPNVACGRRRDPANACGDDRLDESAGLHGLNDLEQRTSLAPFCCRSRTWTKVPLLYAVRSSTSESFDSSLALRPRGWILPRVLMSRPRPPFRRRPAKGNGFPRAEVPSTTRNTIGAGVTPCAKRSAPP